MSPKKLFHNISGRLADYLKVAKYSLGADNLDGLQSTSVMLVCHDANRGFVFNGQKYSQLIDSIKDRFASVGIDSLTISKPFSNNSFSNYGQVVNVNGLIFRAGVGTTNLYVGCGILFN